MDTVFTIGIVGIAVMFVYVYLSKHVALTDSIKADMKLTEVRLKQAEHDLLVEVEARADRTADRYWTGAKAASDYTVGLTKRAENLVAGAVNQAKQDVAVVVDTITKGV